MNARSLRGSEVDSSRAMLGAPWFVGMLVQAVKNRGMNVVQRALPPHPGPLPWREGDRFGRFGLKHLGSAFGRFCVEVHTRPHLNRGRSQRPSRYCTIGRSRSLSLGERFHEPPRLAICSPEPPFRKSLEISVDSGRFMGSAGVRGQEPSEFPSTPSWFEVRMVSRT